MSFLRIPNALRLQCNIGFMNGQEYDARVGAQYIHT